MPILVTGGAGYIGSHVVWALLDQGEEVVVLDDLSEGRRSAVPGAATFVEGNVADAGLVGGLLSRYRIASVIHLAGSASVERSVTDPMGCYANNAMASAALIETCRSGGVEHFIFASTAAVYGGSDAALVGEDSPVAPVSPYGRSKLITEWQLQDIGSTGLRSIVLRPFNVAGADPRGRAGPRAGGGAHLIERACEVATGRRPRLEVYGADYDTPDGTGVRDYVHVSDVASACLDALRSLSREGRSGTFNCGYGRGFSVREIVEAVRRISGRELPVVDAPRRAGDIPRLVADPTRIRSDLGWRPAHATLDQIVGTALEWQRRSAAGR